MNIKIEKTPLKQGQVRIISSKSDGHRSLIAAALAEEESVLFVDGTSRHNPPASTPSACFTTRENTLTRFSKQPKTLNFLKML